MLTWATMSLRAIVKLAEPIECSASEQDTKENPCPSESCTCLLYGVLFWFSPSSSVATGRLPFIPPDPSLSSSVRFTSLDELHNYFIPYQASFLVKCRALGETAGRPPPLIHKAKRKNEDIPVSVGSSQPTAVWHRSTT